MKVLFLLPPSLDGKPPAERIFGCNYGIYRQPHIFLLYAATVLIQAGHEVIVRDFPSEGLEPSDFHLFLDGPSCDLVCFPTVFLSWKTDCLARETIRRKWPKANFVFFSTEPTARPDRFLASDTIVVRGEPERPLLAVVNALAEGQPVRGIPGISYLEDGTVQHGGRNAEVEELDELPFPDRYLLPVSDYMNPKLTARPFTAMVASRGCSFQCRFCVPNTLSFSREIEFKRGGHRGKPPVRLRSVANLVEECRLLAGQGYRSISFLDDQFVWGVERTIEFCKGIEPFGFQWSCLARADMLQDRQMLDWMKRAGCSYIDIGVESFDQAILDDIEKGCRLEQIYSAIERVREAGIEPEINVLIGASPLETPLTIEHTFREAVRLDVEYVLFSICTPFPHTRFEALAREKGWMIKPEYEGIDPMRDSFISYPHLSKHRLELIIRRLYWRFYLRPSYLMKRIRKITGWRDFLSKVRAALFLIASPGRRT